MDLLNGFKQISIDKSITICHTLHMNTDIQKLITDYKAEYLRTNGRIPDLEYCRGWFTLNGNKMRRALVETALGRLKARPNFVP